MTDFNKEITMYVRYQLLSWLGSDGITSCLGSRVGMILTPEAEAERHDFNQEHGTGNCSCFISPPCNSCIHPGNPANQEEDESCWVYAIPSLENFI